MEKAKVEALLDDVARHLKCKDGGELPISQRGVLYACLHKGNPPYHKMSEALLKAGYGRYAWKTLKNDGSIIFSRLTNAFGETIKKTNCSRKLMDWYQYQQREQTLGDVSPPSFPSSPNPSNLLQFESWNTDLERLTASIADGQRVVCISGPARVGKTYFAHALANRLSLDFEAVLWFRASDVPTVKALYRQVLKQLGPKFNPKRSQPWDQSTAFNPPLIHDDVEAQAIPSLLELLQTQRILLVIDQTEFFFQLHQLAGQFNPNCSEYERWLKRLLEFPFRNGCLIWVGREPPTCFNVQYSVLAWHQVRGLETKDAIALLRSRDISTDIVQGWDDIVSFCGGNPAWLIVEASAMQRSHPKTITDFLAAPSLAPAIRSSLTHSLNQLSQAEYHLLWWLLLKPLPFADIRSIQSPEILPPSLEQALISLERRCLVLQDQHQHYRLHPPLLEYVLAEQMVEAIVDDLAGHLAGNLADDLMGDPVGNFEKNLGKDREKDFEETIDNTIGRKIISETACQVFGRLHHYPLFHGTASAQRQQWQQQYVLEAIGDRLRYRYGRLRQDHLAYLRPLLSLARRKHYLRAGYGISNLVNIAVTLTLPLAEFELDHLPIRHVDLRQSILDHACFNSCQFQDTLLPLSVTGPFVADMTPEGDAIAIGDQKGDLLLWRRQAGTLKLQAYQSLSAPIEQVIFQGLQTLLIISEQTLYGWWLDDPSTLEELMPLSAPAQCVSYSPLGYVAVGLTHGSILLWDDMSGQTRTLNAHKAEVYNLAFSPDGRSLASISMDNHMLIWDLTTVFTQTPTYQERSLWGNIGLTASWDRDSLLCAEVALSQIRLRVGSEQLREQPIPGHTIITFSFSKNGRYLLGSSTHQTHGGFLFCWDWQTGAFQQMHQSKCSSQALTVCNQGRWMLTAQSQSIELIDLHQSECAWALTSNQTMGFSMTIEDIQGLNEAEMSLLTPP